MVTPPFPCAFSPFSPPISVKFAYVVKVVNNGMSGEKFVRVYRSVSEFGLGHLICFKGL